MTEEIKENKLIDSNLSLKSNRQILLLFLLPAIFNCLLYIVNFSADFVVSIQHFRENNIFWGWCTLGFMYTPVVIYFLLSITKPDWWLTNEDENLTIWLASLFFQLLLFPFFALYRYTSLIVLSVDALFLSGEKREKALCLAAAPSATELYFFLQAWFQAIPQAVFQGYFYIKDKDFTRTFQSEQIQLLCILMSILVISIQTASFQTYESQKANGRKLPWAIWLQKYKIQLENLEDKKLLQLVNTPANKENSLNHEKNTEMQQDSENMSRPNHRELERKNSSTPPLPPKNVKIAAPPAPLRGITSNISLPVPDVPAPPRPDSIAMDSENSNIQDFKSNDLQDLGIFKKFEYSKSSKQSSTNNDPFNTILGSIWWFLFISVRILTIVIFFKYYPIYLLIVVSVHYFVIISCLFYYAKYYDITTFFINLWLGFIYIFSIIEYRIKFKNPCKLLILYCAFVTIQNSLMTLTWYFKSNWDGILYTYSFHYIFISMSIYIIFAIIFYFLIKSRQHRIYIT